MLIVIRTEHWLAIDKPAGWLSVPGRTNERDARPVAGRFFEKELGLRLWPVHRLDAEVSGLLLFAASAAAHRQGNRWFEERLVEKTYSAFSGGPVDHDFFQEQEWQCRLVRGKRRAFIAAHGQPSLTYARCLGAVDGTYWRWALRPKTGRGHQLRFEMARHGFPIVGDELYGSSMAWPAGGIALRAVRLDLTGIKERMGLPELIEVPDHMPSK